MGSEASAKPAGKDGLTYNLPLLFVKFPSFFFQKTFFFGGFRRVKSWIPFLVGRGPMSFFVAWHRWGEVPMLRGSTSA